MAGMAWLLSWGYTCREGLGAGNGSTHLFTSARKCLVLLHPPHTTLD